MSWLSFDQVYFGSDSYFSIDGFIIPSAQSIVGCVKAKQTEAKHMAYIETVSAAVRFVSFSPFKLIFERWNTYSKISIE